MTFLELCERVAEESGGSGRAPASVTGQVSRQKKIVNWTRDAWTKIQNLHTHWFFRRGEFEGVLVPNSGSYTAASWNIPRFGDWLDTYGLNEPLSLYDPSIGQRDESKLNQLPWDRWKRRWDFGENDVNRPTEYAFTPAGGIRFGATPDAAYFVRGEYTKAPQILAANGDVPDMPEQYHDAIVRRAIMLMSEHDEAINALQLSSNEFRETLVTMEREQLPAFNSRAGRPLA